MNRISYMVAVPADEAETACFTILAERLARVEGVTVFGTKTEEGALSFELSYDGALYCGSLYPADIELPELFRAQHLFPDVDIAAIEACRTGLGMELEFTDNALASYHLQLKLFRALLSAGFLAVIDFSAEKVLSGSWAALAADSHVPPAPRYLYTVQAVLGEDGQVWLHSHGLNRCNVPELEVLGSTRENYEQHYYVIETMANRLLERGEPLAPGEPLFLARLSEEAVLVTTLLPWEEAVHLYDEDILGGGDDRQDGHNEDTSCIFTYPSEEDLEKRQICPLTVYDKLLSENPVYMISTAETERMKALAQERIAYVKRMAGCEGVKILVKLGLLVDEEYNSDGSEREHIWFELKAISDLKVTAELTQEPYYIAGLHTGDVGEYSLDMITDWIIFMPEMRITPDDVYLLAPQFSCGIQS